MNKLVSREVSAFLYRGISLLALKVKQKRETITVKSFVWLFNVYVVCANLSMAEKIIYISTYVSFLSVI